MHDRRTLLAALAAFPAAWAASAGLARAAPLDLAAADAAAEEAHMKLMEVPGLNMHGDEDVVMLLYPGFTALDLVGPQYFLASMMGATVHLATTGADLSPVASDLGLAIAPTCRLADAPKAPTVLFVPGGSTGTLAAAQDPAVIEFLRERAPKTRFVTSVCTGSVILGAAGLLRGKRATSHWTVLPQLTHFGATPVSERVVFDGNLVTGAGVSAGLDFALSLVAAIRGRPYAEAVMLMGEYDPHPPFPGGSPANTAREITDPVAGMFAGFNARLAQLSVAP